MEKNRTEEWNGIEWNKMGWDELNLDIIFLRDIIRWSLESLQFIIVALAVHIYIILIHFSNNNRNPY